MREGLSRQLATTFREKIRSGEWAVGHRIPTTRQLAATYQVSLNTIQNAFRELEAHDLVERSPRRGGFVKGPAISRKRPRVRATTICVVRQQGLPGAAHERDDWTNRIKAAAERELAEQDYHVSMFSYPGEDHEAVQRLMARLDHLGQDLAGVLCFPVTGFTGVLDQLDRRNVPWVSINRPSEHAVHNFVTADNREGGRVVGRCFADLGLDRVLVLGQPFAEGNSGSEKFFGFLRGYLEGGRASRNFDYQICEGIAEHNGYERMRDYTDRFGPPHGVFAAGDLLALGAIRYCRENALPVPEQVSVVGSTGLNLVEYAHPTLTVLQQPMEEMGREAALMLLEMVREEIRRLLGRYLPSPLIVRESLAACSTDLSGVGPS
jgi:DNA-binding LacI/PurR family transcriptional regulator